MDGMAAATPDKKVNIEHMDYDYIDKCFNEKELERILRALKSGREGYYPDLITHCEKKLESINPSNRHLRKSQRILQPGDLGKEELRNLNNDMEKWSEEMTESEQRRSGKKLFTSAAPKEQVNGLGDHNFPPVRGSHVLKGSKKMKLETGDSKRSNSKRIKSSDYKAWDKFDVEKECEKIDNEEPAVPKKKVYEIPKEIDGSALTEEEKQIKAIKEKEKGNEAFKSGDFEEALSYYSRSISLHPIAASYNNRALTHLRLEKWKEAVEDCNAVFSFEGEEKNLKAMLRRASAYKALKLYDEAKTDLLFVLEQEPNNARAKSILNDVENLEASKTTKDEDSAPENDDPSHHKPGKRMIITEVEGNSEDEGNVKGDDGVPEAQNAYSEPESLPEKADSHPKASEGHAGGSYPSSKSQNEPEISDHGLRETDFDEKTQDTTLEQSSAMEDKKDLPTSNLYSAQDSATSQTESQTIGVKSSVEEDILAADKEVISLSPAEGDLSSKDSAKKSTQKESSSNKNEEPQLVIVEPKYPPQAEMLKTKATEFFKSGRYAEACEHYTKAIDVLSKHLESKDTEPGYEIASAVLHNNRAACWLKQGNDRACIDDCTRTLEIKKWDAKAFMRRAMAYEHMEKYTQAWVDFQSAHSMDWQNTLAQDGANRAAKHLREMYGANWREKMSSVPRFPHSVQQTFMNFDTHKTGPKTPSVPETSKTPQNTDSFQNEMTAKKIKLDSKDGEKTTNESASSLTGEKTVPQELDKKEKVDAKPKANQPRKRNKSKSKSTPQNNEEKSKSDADLEERRAKIRRDLYEKLKSQGNDYVKNGDYESAIECYTKCLTYCPNEPAIYTNRALCFLKLKKHISAFNDCTEALRLDPMNVKAYYRRSLARKAEGFYQDAEGDIENLLKIDPMNKAAKAELGALKKLIGDAAKAKGSAEKRKVKGQKSPPKKQLVIEEVDSSSDEAEFILPHDSEPPKIRSNAKMDGEKDERESNVPEDAPKITVLKNDLEMKSHDVEKKLLSPKVVVSDSAKKSQINTAQKSSDVRTSEATDYSKEKSSQKPPSDQRPLTPYEFGNTWNSIPKNSNLSAYKNIIDRVAPKDLPALLSNKIDDHVISVIAKIALGHAKQDGDFQRAYDMMHHLTRADRFTMAAMFLSGDEVQPVKSTLELLSSHTGKTFSKKDLGDLRKAYNLK